MSIGENIKNLRLRNDMTQEELGNKVGVTISMISQIERGTSLESKLRKFLIVQWTIYLMM